jgi:aromatic ring-opening dioxygenase catalytic subunit (LigB family)
MSRIVGAFGSSHAYTFVEPADWEERREFTRKNYARRYGYEPAERPEVAREAPEANEQRYVRIRDGLQGLRSKLQTLRPDALIIIGDDQDENYREDNLPQFAIYLGESVVSSRRGSTEGTRYRCDAALAASILEGAVDAGFDLASSKSFPSDALISHAHNDVLRFMDPDARMSIVPLFVNAIHVPAPTPRRCYEFGRVLRNIIESQPDDKRVAIYASGGLSHYTAGFPWPHYDGPATLGYIATDFDRRAVDLMAQGRGEELAQLSSRDILDNGNIEMRAWIILMGAIGDARPEALVYEPFFRGVMGMAVAQWDLERGPTAVGHAAGPSRS